MALTAAAATPRVEPALLRESDCVRIATSNLDDFDALQELDESRSRLIRIAFDVGRQVTHRLESELSASAGAPREDVALDVDCDRVTVATGNLVDALVAEPGDLEWIWLERVALTVFGHLDDYVRGVAELAHLAGAPGVQVAALVVVLLVVFLEEAELV